MACVKHFALNSMENARFSVDVEIDEAELHEYYLPHFKRVVAEGVDSVMSAYNSVNGEWAGQNEYLLTDVLRGYWGFEGFVLSDFIWGSRDAALSLRAGLDVEAPFAQQRAERLPAALEDGSISAADVERAGLRIIARQLALYARRSADPVQILPPAASLAHEAAVRSMVLVRNEDVGGTPALPLPVSARVAVVGRLATLPNTGDHGSSDVRAPYVVTPAEGLAASFAEVVVDDSGDLTTSAQAAVDSDAVIVVVGYTAAEEGEFVGGEIFSRAELDALYPQARTSEDRETERRLRESAASGRSVVGAATAGGDRRSLRLPDADVALVKAVAAVNERTIVVVVAGNAVTVEEWADDVEAIVIAGYSGMEGGRALAELVTGREDFSARLPFTVPRDESHAAPLDIDATRARYDGSFGQRRLDALGEEARYPFGFGLSYGDTAVTTARVSRDGDAVSAEVTVTNPGERDVHRVVQLYGIRDDGQRFLIGFGSIPVAAGQTATGIVTGRTEYLGRWDAASRRIVAPAGPVTVEAAAFWGDPAALVFEV